MVNDFKLINLNLLNIKQNCEIKFIKLNYIIFVF